MNRFSNWVKNNKITALLVGALFLMGATTISKIDGLFVLLSGGQNRIETVYFSGSTATSPCTSSPCTIYQTSSSWVSSVTRGGTGNYTINFASGVFSSAPMCLGVGYNGVTHIIFVPTTSGVNIGQTTLGSSSSLDDTVWVQCTGPR